MIQQKQLISVCCLCKKTKHKGQWGHYQQNKNDLIAKVKRATHGVCPTCVVGWNDKNRNKPVKDYDAFDQQVD